jgi:hypothetical protein
MTQRVILKPEGLKDHKILRRFVPQDEMVVFQPPHLIPVKNQL